MKKYILVVVFIFSTIIMQAGIVEKTYYFSNPRIIKNGKYQKIIFKGTLQTNFAGYPSLPYHSVALLLPPGEKAVSIEFIGENETEINGSFLLFPHQPSQTLSDTTLKPLIKNENIYNLKTPIPEKNTGKLKTAYMNGHGFALSTFTPVKYVPSRGSLSYFQKVTIKIITAKDPHSSALLKNLKSSKTINQKVLLLAQNPGMLKLYNTRQSRSMSDYRLLIITGSSYVNKFDSLQNIYLERGLRSKVYSTNYIYNNISGQDAQEKIRNFIIQEYQNHGVEFVLLGGDVDIIPYRGFYCYVVSGGGVESNDIPADLYYSALDGTWNDDGDNHWGEPDEDDLLPDISVARLPFDNDNELEILIHKSMWYQNKPVLGELTNVELAGEYLYADPVTWGSDYLNLLIGTHSDNGYTTTGIPPTYNIDSMYEKHQNWSGTDLINKINQGKEFIHHVGHANDIYVAHLYKSDITNANFYAANGVTHNFTLFYSHGCDCGSFDNDDCILERMVNIDNFAVAVTGNSRYGWFNEGQTEGPAAHLHREFVDALFYDSLNMIGRTLLEAKIATSPWVEAPGQWEEGALRWNFYDLNVLGDPALSIWTNEPITINVTYNPTINIGTDSVSVHVENNGNPMNNFTCSIIKDDALLGYGFTDSLGNAWIVFDSIATTPGAANLVVVGYNCLPDTNAVTFVTATTPYLIYAGNTISDPLGNNNGNADFGETISLNVAVANVGDVDANNVNSTLSTLNGYAVITDDTAAYGTIQANDTVWKNNAFECTIADNVPDQEVITFQLQNDADEGSWTSNFSIVANAPSLSAGEIQIDDSQYGNDNGQLDAGETATIIIPSSNFGHASCDNTTAVLTTTNMWVTLPDTLVQLGTLHVDSTKSAAFQIDVNESTPVGTNVILRFKLNSGEYTFEKNYLITIGILIEDFETGDFSKFEWQNGGDMPWTVTGNNTYQGNWSAKSGTIGDLQHSDLFIYITTIADDTVKFAKKVSSEPDYDFLNFYIDDVLINKWSGESDWSEVKYPVSEGQHKLLWSYEKDLSFSSGNDCAWLDNIIFPASTIAVDVKTANTQNINVKLFPNPAHKTVFIKANKNLNSNTLITVFNASGQKVIQKNLHSATKLLSLDISHLPKGLYFVIIKTGKQQYFHKVVHY